MRSSARFVKAAVCLVALFSFLLSPVSALAKEDPTILNTSVNQDVPHNINTLTQSIFLGVLSSVSCLIAGTDPTQPEQKCLGFDPETKKIGYVNQNGGAIGVMGNMIVVLYTPPASSVDYFRSLANNFGIGEKAYAQQGIGYVGLQPIAKLWAGMRNIAYLLFMLVFVLVGLAIMLRVKIDPRTVMTIENQIPRILIALVLVTFSFAIAGLLIDLMYVVIYLVFNVIISNSDLSNNFVKDRITNTQQTFNSNNVFGVMNNLVDFIDITKDASGGVKDIVTSLLGFPTEPTFDWKYLIPGVGSALALKDNFGWLLGIIAGLVAFLVIAIAILIAMFKLWFELIKAYIFILFDTILAPMWIISGLLPGGAGPGFGGWLRNMVAHLSAFPVTIALFLLAAVMNDGVNASTGPIFVPPLIGNLGGVGPIGNLIALGLILISPQAVTMTRDILKAPQFKYTTAIGHYLGAGGGAVNPVDQASKFGSTLFGLSHVPGLPGLASRLLGRGPGPRP